VAHVSQLRHSVVTMIILKMFVNNATKVSTLILTIFVKSLTSFAKLPIEEEIVLAAIRIIYWQNQVFVYSTLKVRVFALLTRKKIHFVPNSKETNAWNAQKDAFWTLKEFAKFQMKTANSMMKMKKFVVFAWTNTFLAQN